jgi:hypothetical protein
MKETKGKAFILKRDEGLPLNVFWVQLLVQGRSEAFGVAWSLFGRTRPRFFLESIKIVKR